jgi:general secretion pathway protein E
MLGDEYSEGLKIYRATGCEHCDFSGYRGRLGIFELVRIDDDMRRAIHDEASESDMIALARRQSPSLMRDGLIKVRQGVTSFDEVLRVTQDAS